MSTDLTTDDFDWDFPPTTAEKGYDGPWERLRAWCVERHIEKLGHVCPGFMVPAHESDDLTGHHVIAISDGGESVPENVRILCRGCHARLHARRRNPLKRCPEGGVCRRPPNGSAFCCGLPAEGGA